MESISTRTHGDVRISSPSRYVNYSSAYVDGKVVFEPCDPVAPSLSSEFSIAMNAATREPSKSMRKRLNVDACDLQTELNKIK